MKVLGNEEVEKRMEQMDRKSKAKLFATLITIQDAMRGVSADGREIVLSMWLEQTLGSDVLTKITETEE